MAALTKTDLHTVASGYHREPTRTTGLGAEAYTRQEWFDLERQAIFAQTWQWVCHVEKLREAGAYLATEVAGQPILLVRGQDNVLRAFYNVCQHRAHALIQGDGTTRRFTCPYHSWTYDLTGQLRIAPGTNDLKDFDKGEISLKEIAVEEFGGFVYVNLDTDAKSLADQSGELRAEIDHFAPDVNDLTHVRRLSYDIKSNWKNLVDNFIECYHCPTAHKGLCDLVDMDTYKVTTHGIYSSHIAKAGLKENIAYSVADAKVRDHAVWWLWPTTCLLRYPGRGNFMVLNIVPVAPDRTLETWDVYLEDDNLTEADHEAIRFVDEVLQVEDIDLVESVQKGMSTPAFTRGRLVTDDSNNGLREHAVHHFHGLLIDAYGRALRDAA